MQRTSRFKIFITSGFWLVYVVPIILFVAIIPLVSQINFMQNDDWVYYRTVANFLKGVFILDKSVGTSFFVQGFMGSVFAKLWGIHRLPVLTLLISVSNFYIFTKILLKIFRLSPIDAVLVGLLFFFNPLQIYLMMGFMVENYTLFFLLISVYFFLSFKREKVKKLALMCISDISLVLSFFVKQLGVFMFVAYGISFFRKGKKLLAISQWLIAVMLVLSYLVFFPKTSVMTERGFQFDRLFNWYLVVLLSVQWLVYLISFTIPLAALFIIKNKNYLLDILKDWKYLLLLVFVFLLVFYLLSGFNYPYMHNTFSSKGFFPAGLNGNKYHFYGYFDLFSAWKLLSIGFFSLVFIIFLRKRTIKSNFAFVYSLLFLMSLMILPKIYDRYLMIVFPFVIVIFLNEIGIFNNWARLFVGSFVLFFMFLSTQYAIDFVKWQRYVWGTSEKLVADFDVSQSSIYSNLAWNRSKGTCYYMDECKEAYKKGSYKYFFSFDNPDVFGDERYFLVDEFSTDFPLNIFIEPKVYLYRYK